VESDRQGKLFRKAHLVILPTNCLAPQQVNPFSKMPLKITPEPLDISLARHYNHNRGEQWHLSELSDKATESTTISWKTSETVRR
jgi:hypothetical protein